MADESGDVRRAEELQKKIAELKEKTLQEESQRLEADTQKRAEASLQNYRVTEEKAFRQRLQEAVDNRKRDENFIRAREQELNSIFDEERRKKTETLRREAEKKRHAAEEERKRQEEIARLKAEEEEKIRREEERRRAEEEERQRLEAERKRREEEALRLELERQRREEERRRQEEERRERIRSQINEAQTYFDKNEYEHALVEVAKALVNDPSNEAALKLDSKIREILRSAKEQEPAEEQPKPARKKARRTVLSPAEEPRKRNPATIVLVIAGIAVIALAVMLLLRRQVFNSDFRIAVIPWTSQTQTAEEQILGSALAMETAGRLNRLPTVTLLGYSSAFHIAGAREDPSRYIFDMGYHYILIGTVTRNEQHVTLTIRLVDSSGRVAWSNVYDRPPTLLASLPDDIALQMVLSMKIPRPDGWLEHGEKIPSDAFDNFLHGKAALLGNTRESMDTALYYFRTALRTTPSYTEALSGAADALLTIYEKRWNHADTVLSRARQYAQATIEADTSSAEGYYQLARVFSQRAKLNEAITEYDNALSRDPNLADAWREKAKVHFRLGQTTQAIDALQRAAELNPRDPEVNTTFGLMYQITRSPARSVYYHELAMAVTRDTISYITGTLSDAIISDPELRLREGHRIITACYRRLQAMPGDYVTLYSLARLRQVTGSRESDSLLRTLQRMCQAEIQQQPKNPVPLMVMAKTLNRLGRFPEATDFALRAMAIDTSDVEMRYQVAQVYAMQMYSVRTKGIDQQKKEASLKELRRAINHSYLLGQIASADFYNMIDQPEFQAAIQTITPQR